MKKTKGGNFGNKNKVGMFDYVNTTILALIGLLCIVPFLYVFFIALSDGTYLTRGQVTFFPKGLICRHLSMC